MLTRRSLLRAIPAVVAAPAIVRAESLMAVKAWGYPQPIDNPLLFGQYDFVAQIHDETIVAERVAAWREASPQLVEFYAGISVPR